MNDSTRGKRPAAANCKIYSPAARLKALGLTKAQVKAAASFFAARSAARIGAAFRDISVVVQCDPESDEAHRAIMGVAGATDVITQAYDAIPPEPPGVYGELYVNADQAIRVASRRNGWSPAREFLLYVAHGMDHLSGADDHAPADYARMRRRELAWLRELPAEARPETA